MSRFHQQFGPNERGRDFIVGDLHGCRTHLDRALAARRFDPATDRLFSVGDLIDRGPDSPGCLDLLDEAWFHATIGNHEMMLIEAASEGERADWYSNGGTWGRDMDDAALAEIADRLRGLPHAISLACGGNRLIGLTHAEYPADDWLAVDSLADDHQARQQMVWGRNVIYGGIERHVRNVTLTVHGHTPIEEPAQLGNALFIDTGCVYGGPLTLLSVGEALAE